MTELLLIIYLTGFVSFTECMFDKFNVWDYLQEKGSKSNFKIIYDLVSCRFCIRFHITWLLYLIFFLTDIIFVNSIYLIVTVSGILTLINKNK